MNTAVLLLAYGGPARLEDVPAYLSDVRGGRPTPQPLVDEFVERYRRIGGRSPLLPITQSVGARLQAALGLPVYIGMRHWHPYIKDAVAQMAVLGGELVIVICLAPHYSRLSIGAYRQKLDEALSAAGKPMAVDFVESWHLQPEYLAGIEARIRQTLQRFPADARPVVIFTAHSLPASIAEHGDPYPDQLHETAECLASALDLPQERWKFAYQSAARTGAPWLGPSVEDVVSELSGSGERDLLVAPIGFVSEHVEVLYDLDVELQQTAAASGVRLERTPMLNDGPELVAALASIVKDRLSQAEGV